jgi:hypothetical protein
MFFFAPIFATLTSVAVLISSTVVANANLISHESRQAVGSCTSVADAYNITVVYTVHIPTPYIGNTDCENLYNMINLGQAWSLDPNTVFSPSAANITAVPTTDWSCLADTDGNTLVKFNTSTGNGAILTSDFFMAFLNISGLECNF